MPNVFNKVRYGTEKMDKISNKSLKHGHMMGERLFP
jgi:hypothetical protein